MAMAPRVETGTAVESSLPTQAVALLTVNVHSTPFTVSVMAKPSADHTGYNTREAPTSYSAPSA